MGNEIITKYLGEFSSPTVSFDGASHSITPMENKSYLNRIDSMRLDFIRAISELPRAMQAIYFDELVTKRNDILKRGYVTLNSSNLLAFAEWGDGNDGRMMMSLKNLDDGLLRIIDKTIQSVKSIIGESHEQAEIQDSRQSCQLTQENGDVYPDVISGTDGLKDYLGCSHNKAFDIIKSRVLPPDIQYMTGRVWKFNRKRLDEFIAKHLEALGKVRKGGVVG